MPVFNGQRYVDEAIASAVGQGFDDFEFVIVDDGSTDDTPSILARWEARDARIRVFRSPRNEGIPAALNRGLAVARGEYVVRQDADDLCIPGRIAKQVATLDADPDVVLVSAGYEIIDAQGRRRGWRMRRETPEVLEYLLNFSNSIGGHGQVMFRRDMVLAAGGYRTEFDTSQDYDLWSRLSPRGTMVVLPLCGMRHRIHDSQVSIASRKRQQGNSIRISLRNVTAFLGREPDADDFAAMTAVWRQTELRGTAARAHRLFTEMYEPFCENATPAQRRRARLAKAQAFFLSAAIHAKRGHVLEALTHAAYSLRWHPLAIFTTAAEIVERAVRYFWRRREAGEGRELQASLRKA